VNRRLFALLRFVRNVRQQRPVLLTATAPGGLRVIEVHTYDRASNGDYTVCLTGEVEDVIVTGWYLQRHVQVRS
jgi:hypothetical protein